MLILFATILLISALKAGKDPLSSALTVCFVSGVIGFFLRAAQLMTDKQAWLFPVLTIICMALAYGTKKTG